MTYTLLDGKVDKVVRYSARVSYATKSKLLKGIVSALTILKRYFMIDRTENYNVETKEVEYTYYSYDINFRKHEFDSCFSALKGLSDYYYEIIKEYE